MELLFWLELFEDRLTSWSRTILNGKLKLFINFLVDIWAQKWLYSVFLLTKTIHFSEHATFDV